MFSSKQLAGETARQLFISCAFFQQMTEQKAAGDPGFCCSFRIAYCPACFCVENSTNLSVTLVR
jgi:hypothetical protein